MPSYQSNCYRSLFKMSGLSYNIDKLLRDIEGGGLHQHTSLELHSVSSASDPAATSFGNSYLRPHMSRSRHPTNVQGQYPIRGRSPDIEDYGSPLDAFGEQLPPSSQSQKLTSLQIMRCSLNRQRLHIDSVEQTISLSRFSNISVDLIFRTIHMTRVSHVVLMLENGTAFFMGWLTQ